jgi:tRNA(Ile)-lysidine synthase
VATILVVDDEPDIRSVIKGDGDVNVTSPASGVPRPSLDSLVTLCTFPPPGTDTVAGVSGGADSSALLVLAVHAGCRVTAVHVDHGLRAGSSAEADMVRDLAARLGVGFRSERIEVDPGPNLEARARTERRRALGGAAMTGHTADDQAETLLLRLTRGSGLDGLTAMRPGPAKPILALRRADTCGVCEWEGIAYLRDPSNDDPSHLRNRMRAEVLPLLDDVARRDTAELLARAASLMAEDADFLDELAAAIDPSDARALAASPLPLARRAIRVWLCRDGYPPDLATVERVLDVARGDAMATDVGGGRRVSRSSQRLALS